MSIEQELRFFYPSLNVSREQIQEIASLAKFQDKTPQQILNLEFLPIQIELSHLSWLNDRDNSQLATEFCSFLRQYLNQYQQRNSPSGLTATVKLHETTFQEWLAKIIQEDLTNRQYKFNEIEPKLKQFPKYLNSLEKCLQEPTVDDDSIAVVDHQGKILLPLTDEYIDYLGSEGTQPQKEFKGYRVKSLKVALKIKVQYYQDLFTGNSFVGLLLGHDPENFSDVYEAMIYVRDKYPKVAQKFRDLNHIEREAYIAQMISGELNRELSLIYREYQEALQDGSVTALAASRRIKEPKLQKKSFTVEVKKHSKTPNRIINLNGGNYTEKIEGDYYQM